MTKAEREAEAKQIAKARFEMRGYTARHKDLLSHSPVAHCNHDVVIKGEGADSWQRGLTWWQCAHCGVKYWPPAS